MAQYEWIPLYKEIAQKLLQFYGDRRPLVQLVNDIFAETGLNMPKLEQNSQLVDIDPFTVFGLFNKSSMREDKRRKILAALLQKLEISEDLPANFDGIPVLNNQNATFYYFLPGGGKMTLKTCGYSTQGLCAMQWKNQNAAKAVWPRVLML